MGHDGARRTVSSRGASASWGRPARRSWKSWGGLENEALTYVIFDILSSQMSPEGKPLVWLHGEVKTPPFGKEARIEAGVLLRQLQQGTVLSLPHSRPMPQVGPRCHELRAVDEAVTWRILYRADQDAVVIAEVFVKKTPETPKAILKAARRRLREHDNA
jgi:phage-related protein